MRFDKPRYFRQSMTWVHTWAGLLLGWLLFAVFVTGTLSFFRGEITLWMQPEVHQAGSHTPDVERTARLAFDKLSRDAAGAQQWAISLPNARTPVANLSWREATPESAPADRNTAQAPSGPRGEGRESREGREGREGRAPRDSVDDTEGGSGDARVARSSPRAQGEHASHAPQEARSERSARGGQEDSGAPNAAGGARSEGRAPTQQHTHDHGPQAQQGAAGQRQQTPVRRAVMDPNSGEILEARPTAGGNFLYRFHFELHGMDRLWGRWIVGIATMFMFVALITGVIVHRQIFRDFFTFRPGKGKRSWLDAHNATGVLSMPFHLVITFSGLVLLGPQLLPSAVSAVYPDDSGDYGREMRGMNNAAPTPRPAGQAAPLTDIGPLLEQARQAWPDNTVGSILVSFPGDANATIELRQARGNSLVNRASVDRLLFNGVTGAALPPPTSAEPSGVRSVQNVLSAVHLGRFASPIPRWMLFLSGVLGCVMVASGLVLWVISRAKDSAAQGHKPRGHRLVEVLNIGAVSGLMIAIGAYFWANRLIPAELAERNLWEIRVFFSVWLLTLIHAAWRPHKRAWIEQLIAGGSLLCALPILNAATGGAHLGHTLVHGAWQVAGFDLTAIACGALLLFAARGVVRHVPRVRATPAKAPRPAANTSPAAVGDGPSPLITPEHAG